MPGTGGAMTRAWLVVGLGLWLGTLAPAALGDGVYVRQGENGPLFSDHPIPGGKEVELPPLNTMPAVPAETVKEAWPAGGNAADQATSRRGEREVRPPSSVPSDAKAPAGDVADASPYQRFQILQPERYSGVLVNTAVFEVRLAVEPPLRLAEQHAFVVSINGQPVNQRYSATEFTIPPDFWEQAPAPNQMMQLDAAIVDGKGQVLKRAEPVRFYLRYAVVPVRPPVLVAPAPAPRLPPGRPDKRDKPKADASAPGGSAILNNP